MILFMKFVANGIRHDFRGWHPFRPKRGWPKHLKYSNETEMKRNQGVWHDEWTNEREIRDKYMIYIYILLVFIRHFIRHDSSSQRISVTNDGAHQPVSYARPRTCQRVCQRVVRLRVCQRAVRLRVCQRAVRLRACPSVARARVRASVAGGAA